MRDTRIAVMISHAPLAAGTSNLERIGKWAAEAAAAGAEIACFPELTISGYSTREIIVKTAEPVPGPSSRALIDIARRTEVTILAGLAEVDTEGRLYATHLVARPNGRLDAYRKIHLAPPEIEVFTGADQIVLFDLHGLRFGIQLCYDAHFPELSTQMAAAGAEIIFIPHASPRGSSREKYDSWMRHLTARAFDNSLFVIACNQTGDNGAGLLFPGVAVAISPSGETMERVLSNDESMLVVDLKMKDIETVRGHRMRHFFPNRRPEIYKTPVTVAGN